MRELCLKRMEDYGTKCRDVRTREVGIVNIHQNVRLLLLLLPFSFLSLPFLIFSLRSSPTTLSSFAETTSPMRAGRPSSPTRTLSRTSLLASFAFASAQLPPSVLSFWARSLLSESFTSTERPCPSTTAILPRSSSFSSSPSTLSSLSSFSFSPCSTQLSSSSSIRALVLS